MFEQDREGERRSRGPLARDEVPVRGANLHDESTERYATGWERLGVIARAREDAGARIVPRSTWSSDDPGAA